MEQVTALLWQHGDGGGEHVLLPGCRPGGAPSPLPETRTTNLPEGLWSPSLSKAKEKKLFR